MNIYGCRHMKEVLQKMGQQSREKEWIIKDQIEPSISKVFYVSSEALRRAFEEAFVMTELM